MNVLLTCLMAFLAANPVLKVSGIADNPIPVPVVMQSNQAPVSSPVCTTLGETEQNLIWLQPSMSQPGKVYFILPPRSIPANGELQLTFQEKTDIPVPSPFTFTEKEDKYLELTEEGKPVFVYNFGWISKEGVPANRSRSCYVHPVWGLDGEILSDDFPRDHYHHRGIFWTWPRVTVTGKTVDLWTIYGIHQRFEKWLVRETGPVCAVMSVQNGWYLDNDQRVMEEKVELVTYRTGETGRAIDITIQIKALDQPVTLLGSPDQNKGYGGLCFRPAPGVEKVISGPNGVHPKDTNRMRIPWADYSGRWGDSSRISGSAILVPLDHPDYPPGWTLRYYGFSGVAWPGNQTHTIEAGQEMTLHYRFWVHRGGAEEGRVREAYDAYTLIKTYFE